MDLDGVTFPALVVADDGWVQEFGSKEELSTWTYPALSKYRSRSVVLYDCRDRAWQVDSVAPLSHKSTVAKLIAGFCNRKIPVRITVRLITEDPLQVVLKALTVAIDADDDILTQFTEAAELKNNVGTAHSFEALIGVLKDKRAI